jgi:signal transduction histidine kinase
MRNSIAASDCVDLGPPPAETAVHADGPPLDAKPARDRFHGDRCGDPKPSEALRDRLQFERLLLELSAAFANLPLHKIDQQIEHGLQRLGQFLSVDRSSFAELSEDKPDMVVTHCYVAPGVAPFPAVAVDDVLPWCASRIRRGQVIGYSRLPDELPAEAVAEREYCRQHGLKSSLAIPLKVGGALRCVITFATFGAYRDWSDELVERLWLVGEVFANSLARKRSEEETQHLREVLARMGRVTLLGELAAAIAHEINQPLCAIVSNAQACQRMLSKGHLEINEVRESLRDIASDSLRANEVVVRVRKMLEKRTLQRAPLRLGDAAAEVVAMIRAQVVRSGVEIALDFPPDLPPVLGDRVQLQQVVLNLALNAIDAMAALDRKSRRILIAAARDAGAGLLVTVRDSGPGIAPQHFASVFEPFFTTKPAGIGVGLAICRSIIESHGGKIWADSQPGCGAVFQFTLPIEQSPVEESQPT